MVPPIDTTSRQLQTAPSYAFPLKTLSLSLSHTCTTNLCPQHRPAAFAAASAAPKNKEIDQRPCSCPHKHTQQSQSVCLRPHKLWCVWESAAAALDDNVGCVVSCTHTLLYLLASNKLRQEATNKGITCNNSSSSRFQHQYFLILHSATTDRATAAGPAAAQLNAQHPISCAVLCYAAQDQISDEHSNRTAHLPTHCFVCCTSLSAGSPYAMHFQSTLYCTRLSTLCCITLRCGSRREAKEQNATLCCAEASTHLLRLCPPACLLAVQ